MAPNLVTLVGFFFIIGNVALLELYVPDFVGPVSWYGSKELRHGLTSALRHRDGCIVVLLLASGCKYLDHWLAFYAGTNKIQ